MKQNNWLARWLLLSGAGLLIARNQFFGLSPFALAYSTLLFYFARDFMLKGQRIGSFLFFSVLMGIVMEFSVGTGIRYGLSMLISAGLMHVKWKGRKMTVPGIALCAMAGGSLGGLITYLLLGSLRLGYTALLLYLLEALFSFFLVFLFDSGLRCFLYAEGKIRYEELLSMMLLISFVLMGCPKLSVYGFDVVSALRFFFILLTSYLYGAGAGGVSGMVMGFLLLLEDFMGSPLSENGIRGILAFGNYNDRILLLCLCGIMAGMGREFSKIMAAAGFLVTGAAFYYLGNRDVITPFSLLEICTVSIVFLIIPAGYLLPDFDIGAFKGKWTGRPKDKSYRECFQGIIRDRMRGYSKAFSRLTKSFLSLSEERQEMGFPDAVALVDGVSDRICGNCSFLNDCVTRNRRGNLETSAGILRAAMLEGEVSGEYLPKEFLEGCIHAEDYLYAMDKEILLARMNLKWHNNMAQTREAIASQMKEMAQIMDELSKETMGFEEIHLFDVDRLRFMLKRQCIELGQIVCLKTRDGHREIHLFARAARGCVLTTKELVELIGRQCRFPLKPFGSTKLVIDGDFKKISLREDTRYGILMGIARCTKSGEKVSGDSFSCMNLESGKAVLSISDGMGSGRRAFLESQAIMDLTEEMLEAGFSHETAIRLIHSVLMEHPEKQSFSTLDLCMVDLYTADMEIIKIGGAPAFIKRGRKVETIEASTLPIGILDQTELASTKRKLYDKDIIIMMSDGVLDGLNRMFPDAERTEKMAEEIAGIYQGNPRDIAKALLKTAGGDGQARDDMTIIAALFYEKRKE